MRRSSGSSGLRQLRSRSNSAGAVLVATLLLLLVSRASPAGGCPLLAASGLLLPSASGGRSFIRGRMAEPEPPQSLPRKFPPSRGRILEWFASRPLLGLAASIASIISVPLSVWFYQASNKTRDLSL